MPGLLTQSLMRELGSFRNFGRGQRRLVSGHGRFLGGFFSRTPGPPPFSSMNTIPAASSAWRTARSLAAVIEVSSSVSSALRMVVTLTADARARSSALHRTSARPARSWALVSGFDAMLTVLIPNDIIHSIWTISVQWRYHLGNVIFRLGGRHEIGHVDKIA